MSNKPLTVVFCSVHVELSDGSWVKYSHDAPILSSNSMKDKVDFYALDKAIEILKEEAIL